METEVRQNYRLADDRIAARERAADENASIRLLCGACSLALDRVRTERGEPHAVPITGRVGRTLQSARPLRSRLLWWRHFAAAAEQVEGDVLAILSTCADFEAAAQFVTPDDVASYLPVSHDPLEEAFAERVLPVVRGRR
jgi:hypothetical protein